MTATENSSLNPASSTFQPPVSLYQTADASDNQNDSSADSQHRQGFLGSHIVTHPYRWELFKMVNSKLWWIYTLVLVHIVILYLPTIIGGKDSFTCNGFPDTNTTMNVSCSELDGYIFVNEAGTVLETETVKGVIVTPCNYTTAANSSSSSSSSVPTLELKMLASDPLDIYKNVGLRIWLTMSIEDMTFLYWIFFSIFMAVLTLPMPTDDSKIRTSRAKWHKYSVLAVKICTILYVIWKLSWILIGTDLLMNVCSYQLSPRWVLLGAYFFYILELLIVCFSTYHLHRVLAAGRAFLSTKEGYLVALQKLEEGDAGNNKQHEENFVVGCESGNSLLAHQQSGEVGLLLTQDDSPSVQI